MVRQEASWNMKILKEKKNLLSPLLSFQNHSQLFQEFWPDR